MAATGVESLSGRLVDGLSGGQRVWVAMELAQQTPLLLLEEPTTTITTMAGLTRSTSGPASLKSAASNGTCTNNRPANPTVRLIRSARTVKRPITIHPSSNDANRSLIDGFNKGVVLVGHSYANSPDMRVKTIPSPRSTRKPPATFVIHGRKRDSLASARSDPKAIARKRSHSKTTANIQAP